MRIATLAISSLLLTTLVLGMAIEASGASINVIYKADNVQILVAGYDQAPATLSEPLQISGEVLGGGGALSQTWNVLEWINAAPPWGLNEWSTQGAISGGLYDGELAKTIELLQPGTTTADALWMETGASAWASNSVYADIFAIALKADDNDGIADFFMDDLLVATIDLYHDENAGFGINRATSEDPTGILGDYYLPVLVVIDLSEANNVPIPAFDLPGNGFVPHTFKVVGTAPSLQAPHYTDDVEILGAAAMTTTERIVPEPGSMLMLGAACLLLRKRKKSLIL